MPGGHRAASLKPAAAASASPSRAVPGKQHNEENLNAAANANANDDYDMPDGYPGGGGTVADSAA